MQGGCSGPAAARDEVDRRRRSLPQRRREADADGHEFGHALVDDHSRLAYSE
jgi:hypothetical protein